MSVTAEELKALLKQHGWRLEWRKQAATRYASAIRGSRNKRERRYLCGEHGLPNIRPEDIVAKIQ